MKYLKKYSKVFEWKSEPIPDNFIKLQSIGHVLDPDTGRVYAMFTRGGYDIENPYWIEDEEGLSDEDIKTIDKYITYSKDVIDVDDELLSNVKDFLLDLTDNSYKVSVGIEANTIHVLTKSFGRDRDWYHYVDLFPKYLKMVKGSDKYTYSINIKGNYSSKFESNITDEELVSNIVSLLSYLNDSKYTIDYISIRGRANSNYFRKMDDIIGDLDHIEKLLSGKVDDIKSEFSILIK
jgi:hypothetical protein